MLTSDKTQYVLYITAEQILSIFFQTVTCQSSVDFNDYKPTQYLNIKARDWKETLMIWNGRDRGWFSYLK